MACYTSRTYEDRKVIQRLWESGVKVEKIAANLGAPPPSINSELRRGKGGSRLPNHRLCYHADPAQLRSQQSFQRRGRKDGESRKEGAAPLSLKTATTVKAVQGALANMGNCQFAVFLLM